MEEKNKTIAIIFIIIVMIISFISFVVLLIIDSNRIQTEFENELSNFCTEKGFHNMTVCKFDKDRDCEDLFHIFFRIEDIKIRIECDKKHRYKDIAMRRFEKCQEYDEFKYCINSDYIYTYVKGTGVLVE